MIFRISIRVKAEAGKLLDFEITTKIFIYKFISISILFYIDDVTCLEGKSLNDGVQ
ncbi:hypothetical protein ACUN24_14430 [Pedobacter sp. WC2501]|uniref:hypothetical protein n=1 Tax=Pedobacter sp. WC2501 TaxID=3461400 RepID=UPI0040466CA4